MPGLRRTNPAGSRGIPCYHCVTVTKTTSCDWCGDPLVANCSGRPRRYCRRSHRQRAYEARLLAERMGLDPGDALVPVDLVRWAREGIRALSRAIRDVERGLRAGDDYETSFRHLYAAAVGLGEVRLEPRAVHEPEPEPVSGARGRGR